MDEVISQKSSLNRYAVFNGSGGVNEDYVTFSLANQFGEQDRGMVRGQFCTHLTVELIRKALDQTKTIKAVEWKAASDNPLDYNFGIIKKALASAASSLPEKSKLTLIVNPSVAVMMSQTGEMRAVLNSDPPASRTNRIWGLPDAYAGVDIVVEDSVYAGRAPDGGCNYVMDGNKAILTARGALEVRWNGDCETAHQDHVAYRYRVVAKPELVVIITGV